MAEREFDIVLFGASGFVGALVAEHLATNAGEGVRIALAGRSCGRLGAVRERLPGRAQDWPVVEVDASDLPGLRQLASRTTVLATTVGPYARYGREVVRAAAEEGTSYADLTGEVLFVRWTLDEVDARARQTGARIVHSCGFDSIPSDLGVALTAETARRDGQGALEDAVLVVRSLEGGISGGTIDSARQQAIALRSDPASRRVLRDPLSLIRGGGQGPPVPTPRSGVGARLRRAVPVERDPAGGRWLGPFPMADHNARIVGLSNALTGWSYGRGMRYRERVDAGAGWRGALRAVGMGVGASALLAGLSWTPTRALLDRLLPSPGEGPSAEQRARGRFRMEITARTATGARYRTTVAADRDPGYGGTAIMLGESALCLALEGPRLPDRSGVLTTATALGDPLVERLRAQGFTFAVERIG